MKNCKELIWKISVNSNCNTTFYSSSYGWTIHETHSLSAWKFYFYFTVNAVFEGPCHCSWQTNFSSFLYSLLCEWDLCHLGQKPYLKWAIKRIINCSWFY